MKVGRFKLETAEDLRRNGIRDEDALLSDRTYFRISTLTSLPDKFVIPRNSS